MIRFRPALIQIDLDFRELGLNWALVGGLAVWMRDDARTTRDIDIAIAVEDDRQAESVVRDLLARGYQLYSDPIEQAATGRLSTVRLKTAGKVEEQMLVDLLFASSGLEREIVGAAEPIELMSGLAIPVATIGHLLALKTLAGRYQDRTDFGNLLRKATSEDLRKARESLTLIEERGYGRRQDLQEIFDELLALGTTEQPP